MLAPGRGGVNHVLRGNPPGPLIMGPETLVVLIAERRNSAIDLAFLDLFKSSVLLSRRRDHEGGRRAAGGGGFFVCLPCRSAEG